MDKDHETNFKNIPGFWNKVTEQGGIQKICDIMNPEFEGVMGVSDFHQNREENFYYVAVASTQPVPDGMVESTIPANMYALFSGEGAMPDTIQELLKRIMMEWFPTSGYEWAEAPDIELYLNPDPKDAKFEVWVPIKTTK